MMNGALLSMVVSTLSCLCVAFEIPVKPYLDMKKLAGKWHPILRAKYDPTDQPFYTYTMSPLNDGNVILKVEVPRVRACRLNFVALYAIQPGVFENADGKLTVHLVDTDYDNYHISHTERDNMAFMNLYGREKEVSEEVTKKFLDMAQKVMLNPMLLFYQHKTDLCLSPPQKA
nr:lipocalin-like [Pogona vitticeps]